MTEAQTLWEVFVPNRYLRTEYLRTGESLIITTIRRSETGEEFEHDKRGYLKDRSIDPMKDFDYPMHRAAACPAEEVAA